jgi:hypothetical protein
MAGTLHCPMIPTALHLCRQLLRMALAIVVGLRMRMRMRITACHKHLCPVASHPLEDPETFDERITVVNQKL